ncbi:hypothetical protein V492_07908 [Pseudogymnoascus sp. VKM F-4246]|nr:hypothetical protein V492_07908 [Pseudogymnoascus sp. VKM F-4246]
MPPALPAPDTQTASTTSFACSQSDILKRHEALHLRNGGITNVAGARIGNRKRRKGEPTKRIINSSHLSTQPENDDSTSDAIPLSEDHSPYVLQHGTDTRASHTIQAVHPDVALAGSLADVPAQPGLETADATLRDVASLPFDFSFLLPPTMDNWFTGEFYSALNETGIGWDDSGAALDPTLSADRWNTSRTRQEHSQYNSCRPTAGDPRISRPVRSTPHDAPITVHATRAPSARNEAADEDGWEFAWNPRSSRNERSELISIPHDDPIHRAHNPEYDISAKTYQALVDWLDWTHDQRLPESSPLNIPGLDVINLFIALFFQNCHPQMPVIHLATLVMDKDLPPALLAAMVVIGATYSHQKHTRSFTITLLDRVRRGLIMNTEYDNGLMREPMIIYAFLLVCHTGLWSGNNRSYEFAESLRGSVVNLCRRKGFSNDLSQAPTPNQDTVEAKGLEVRWREWISDESQKRLCWAVYMLDCQFPTLLNLPSTISRSELSALECPCDEEFWLAPSARHWKRLLGPASVPPSISFITAASPFIVPHIAEVAHPRGLQNDRRDWQAELCPMKLNPWSQFIVLLVILSQLYEYHQEVVVAGNIYDGDVSCDNRDANDDSIDRTEFPRDTTNQMREMLGGPSETQGWDIWKHLAKRKMQLFESLDRWSEVYSHPSKTLPRLSNASDHFQESSILLYNLGRLLLEVSLTDLQDAIGKSGPSKIPEAMANLSSWVKLSPQSLDAVLLCIETIDSLAPVNQNVSNDKRSAARYSIPSIITVFLCHTTLWAFVNVAGRERKQELVRLIETNHKIKSGHFAAVITRVLIENGEGGRASSDASRLIFRSAAEVLTRMDGYLGSSFGYGCLVI